MNRDQTSANRPFKGRGAGINVANRFERTSYVAAFPELIDEDLIRDEKTQYIEVFPKTIINKVESPDIPGKYSMNPYQGCEHGCLYCYARPTHEYWGYSAGLDFERKILVKKNAAELLEAAFLKKNWDPSAIMLSGNTDCYQPIERKLGITRKILEICLKYHHPVSLITKNALVLRDLDLLEGLSKLNLVHVMITVTSLDEELRLKLEPRTSTYSNRLKVIGQLADKSIPCGVMMAPVIPGLNSHEIPEVLKQAAAAGASSAGMTILRLNGNIAPVFRQWLELNFPDRAEKVWHQVEAFHGGKVNDSRFGARMKGEGKEAEAIHSLFRLAVKRHMLMKSDFRFNSASFLGKRNQVVRERDRNGQGVLFEEEGGF